MGGGLNMAYVEQDCFDNKYLPGTKYSRSYMLALLPSKPSHGFDHTWLVVSDVDCATAAIASGLVPSH